MVKALPSKWIRKAISDAIDEMVVSGIVIPCFDVQVSAPNLPQHFVLMTSQIEDVDKASKCEYLWDSSILLDIVTTYPKPGNPGSRLLSDDIADAVREFTMDLQLDINSGLEIVTITQSFPSDIVTITQNQNVFRKFVRLELKIK